MPKSPPESRPLGWLDVFREPKNPPVVLGIKFVLFCPYLAEGSESSSFIILKPVAVNVFSAG